MFSLRLTSVCFALFLTSAAADTPQGLHSIVALLPKGQINKPYHTTTLIAGGTPPYAYQMVGALPGGMSVSSNGALYGTPRDVGTFRFKLDVTDSTGATVQVSYALQTAR